MTRVKKWNPRMKPRIVVVFYLMVLFVFYLGYNLVRVQAMESANLTKRGKDQHIGVNAIPALRGALLDRNHEILAASLSLPSVAADPSNINPKDKDSAADFLSREFNLSRPEVRRLLDSRGSFVWLARKIPEQLAQHFEKNNPIVPRDKEKGPGVFIVREPTGKRFYPKGRLAVHILGYTGIDDNGLDGIEAMYEAALRGKPGELEAEMDRDGRVIPSGWQRRTPAQPGHNVVLTIDESIQYIAEREAAAVVKKHHAKGAVVVVMDVKTGDILALANKPDYPTRDFSKVPVALRRNRAVADAYEPGSTFKVFLAAAALDSGKVSMSDRFFCGRSITVDGWEIHNADDGLQSESGSEDLKGIITYSFNVGTTAVALRLGKRTLFDYICRFGFGERTGIALPGEAEGIVQPFKGWANVTLATNSFGQGVSVTPLQLVNGMQAVANGGVMMKPRLVKEIISQDGKVVRTIPPTVRRRVISEKTALHMREILRNVVTNGTGKKAEIPGFPSAGKTGTASVVEGGVYASGKYVASILGFAPYNDPRIVVLVKVEEPKGVIWGGAVAGPVFPAVAREALWRLGVKPQPIVEKAEKKQKT